MICPLYTLYTLSSNKLSKPQGLHSEDADGTGASASRVLPDYKPRPASLFAFSSVTSLDIWGPRPSKRYLVTSVTG